MPKPFKGEYQWSLRSLEERPELAKHIALIASMWSVIEAELAKILSLILHTDALVGATIYSVIKSEGARTEAIESVIKHRLTASDLEQYRKLKDRVRRVGGQRDKFLHGLWAVPKGMPDSLVLVDSRAYTLLEASMVATMGGSTPREKLDQHFTLFDAHMKAALSYDAKDFIEVETLIENLSRSLAAFSLRQYVRNLAQSSPDHPGLERLQKAAESTDASLPPSK
jgi:hypothetical protein